jgi:hypothetical protein
VIQHIKTQKYYAGSKWSKSKYKSKERFADPKFLLTEDGYHTSSKIVQRIIAEEGLSVFKIRKIKVFKNAEKARNYESRFLQKVKAKTNDKFLNIHENEIIAWGTEEYKEKCLKKYGVEHPSMMKSVQEKANKTLQEKYGVDYAFQLKTKEVMLERYGYEHHFSNKEIQEKRKKTFLEKYGDVSPTRNSKVKLKAKNTRLEKYGSYNSILSKQVSGQRSRDRLNRNNVAEIFALKEKYNFKLPKSWWMKSDDYVNDLLKSLLEEYGEENS